MRTQYAYHPSMQAMMERLEESGYILVCERASNPMEHHAWMMKDFVDQPEDTWFVVRHIWLHENTADLSDTPRVFTEQMRLPAAVVNSMADTLEGQ